METLFPSHSLPVDICVPPLVFGIQKLFFSSIKIVSVSCQMRGSCGAIETTLGIHMVVPPYCDFFKVSLQHTFLLPPFDILTDSTPRGLANILIATFSSLITHIAS